MGISDVLVERPSICDNSKHEFRVTVEVGWILCDVVCVVLVRVSMDV